MAYKMEGMLRKKRAGGISGLRSWKSRYFVLDDTGLTYYNDHVQRLKHAARPSRMFPPRSILHAGPIKEDKKRQNQRFKVVTTERTLELRAEDPETAREWIKAFAAFMDDKKQRAGADGRKRSSGTAPPASAVASPRANGELKEEQKTPEVDEEELERRVEERLEARVAILHSEMQQKLTKDMKEYKANYEAQMEAKMMEEVERRSPKAQQVRIHQQDEQPEEVQQQQQARELKRALEQLEELQGTDEALNEARDEATALAEHNTQLSHERDDLEGQVEALQRQVEQLKATAARRDAAEKEAKGSERSSARDLWKAREELEAIRRGHEKEQARLREQQRSATDGHRAEVAKLREQVTKLELAASRAQAEAKDESTALQRAKSEAASAQEAVNKAEKARADAEKRAMHAEQEARDAERERDSSLTAAQGEAATLRALVDDAKRDAQALQERLDEAEKQRAEQEKSHSSTGGELQARIAALHAEKRDLSAQLAEAEGKQREQAITHREAVRRLEAVHEKALAELKSELADNKADAKSKVEELKREHYEEARKDRARAQDEREALETKVAHAERARAEESKTNELKQKRLEDKASALEGQVKELSALLARAETRQREKASQSADALGRMESQLNETRNSLSRQLGEAEGQRDRAQEELARAQAAARKKQQQLEKELADAQHAVVRGQRDARTADKAHKATVQRLEDEAAMAKSALHKANDDANKLRARQQELEKEVNGLKANKAKDAEFMHTMKRDISSSIAKLQQREKELAGLRERNESLQDAVKSLNGTVEGLRSQVEQLNEELKRVQDERAQEEHARAVAGAWAKYEDDEGTPYYHNSITDETVWEKPDGFVEAEGASSSGSSGGMGVRAVEEAIVLNGRGHTGVRLPVNVLAWVFSFLPVEDLYSGVARTSKEWSLVSEADCLWEPLAAPEALRLNKRLKAAAKAHSRRTRTKITSVKVRLFHSQERRSWKQYVTQMRAFSSIRCKSSKGKTLSVRAFKDCPAPFDEQLRDGRVPTPNSVVIVDNGACSFKFGVHEDVAPSQLFSRMAVPSHEMPSHAKHPLSQVLARYSGGSMMLRASKDLYYPQLLGKEVYSGGRSEGTLCWRADETVYDVSATTWGDSPDWAKVRSAYAHMFDSLGVNPRDHVVVATIPAMAPTALGEGLTNLLFEQFNVPGVHVARAPLLAAHFYGFSTGLVVDIGMQAVKVLPVVDGCVLEHSVKRVRHLGGQISTCLAESFVSDLPDGVLSDLQTNWTARDIKETLGRCSSNYKSDSKKLQLTYAVPLPGGSTELDVTQAALDTGEVLFSPKQVLGDKDASVTGLQQLIRQVIESVDVDLRRPLLSHVLLAGAGSLSAGIQRRLEVELKEEMPYCKPYVRVLSDPARDEAAWQGARLLVKTGSTFHDAVVTREEWEQQR